MPMLCDLCHQSSDHVQRVNAWVVCQWCVSHDVLEHALNMEAEAAKLHGSAVATGRAHRKDVRREDQAAEDLVMAGSDNAMQTRILANIAADSALSLEVAQKAANDLKDFTARERQSNLRLSRKRKQPKQSPARLSCS